MALRDIGRPVYGELTAIFETLTPRASSTSETVGTGEKTSETDFGLCVLVLP